ncbi:EF-hand domain-containing protein [Sinorhizobium sp. BG8]|uniref:EF-hand domain-containing protein n=1 Tax=Sinorhizobium sp. BG8 TaxID=2613773 RepID=UPI00193D77F3|nr:EF-hand domain-containing protein [Sinorhizobium sp. BG8]QRM56948.1 hypothetical protein F3Y30_15195 [Sinorhizobium sp. BG8]
MTSISSTSTSTYQYQSVFSRSDKNGDGKVTSEEFVAARPSDVSESQASSLYSKIAGDSSDGLTEDQLNEGLEAERKTAEEKFGGEMMAMMLSMQQGTDTGVSDQPPSSEDLFSSIDADGDGTITRAEFVNARPENVSEEDATSLFDSLDSEGTGSLTEEQFVEGLEANRPAGPPPGGAPPSEESSEDETESAIEAASLAATTASEILEKLQAAIAAYQESLSSVEADLTESLSV